MSERELPDILSGLGQDVEALFSRGVARAIGVLLNMPGRVDLANGALIEFDLASFENQAAVWDEL